MPRRPIYVDRGSLLEGQDKTSRDSRVPFNFPRSIDNFSLPDKRARRRVGYGSVHEHVRTQALCKHTGVSFGKRLAESDHNKGTFLNSPLSYGVIRWNTDFQLRRSESKTVEFMLRVGDKEELVANPFTRYAHYDTVGPPVPATGWSNFPIRQSSGVIVLDQTLLSNEHQFEDGSIDQAGVVTANAVYNLASYKVTTSNNWDVFALTAMAFGYSASTIFFDFNLIHDTTDVYWRTISLAYSIPTYVPGTIYHIAIVHDHTAGADGSIKLYVDGVERDEFLLPITNYKFAGERDVINGITYASGLQRDIVVLNECTARASYASACKVDSGNHGNQTFQHALSFAGGTAGLSPWALSPPRGTAMWDLRIWNEARSSANITAWQNKRILSSDTNANLKGNWHLNDGSVVCTNKVTGLEKRYCCIHHGYPGYVNETDMLNGIGLKLGDGQHIIRSFGKGDRDLGIGLAAKLANVFEPDIAATGTLRHKEKNDFTVQIQIMVPDSFQPELNDRSTPATVSYDINGVETRRPINDARYELKDGGPDTAAISRLPLRYRSGTTPAGAHMAYDQTLFSIEGTQVKDTATRSQANEADRRRIPVARAVLTPAGKVAFELFKDDVVGTIPWAIRLVSATALTVGKTYTLTFVQRSKYVYDSATRKLNASDWTAELWIENITDATAATLDASASFGPETASLGATGSLEHELNYDIIVGASYVNDGWDACVNMAAPPGGTATAFTSFEPTNVRNRGDNGPWPVHQHFMNPYQDQPGNFVVGIFRLWSVAVQSGEIGVIGNIRLGARYHTPDLLVNLEFEEITGIELPNKCRYPDTFSLGYKGWGVPQGYSELFETFIGALITLPLRMHDSPWANEDCLGYIKIDSEDYDARQAYTEVHGILPFKSSFAQQYGITSIYDDAPAFDETINNVYEPMFITNHGQLSEFTPKQDWYGTVVGDRLFMTGPGGLPKVWNGRHCTVAGFKRWTGGTPLAYGENTTTGALTSSKWYGVVIVYFAEEYGIYHVSPVSVVYLHTGEDTINLYNVPQHPDPRVSVVDIYRTLGQATEDLANFAPLYKTRIRLPRISNSNSAAKVIILTEGDTDLPGAILDRNVTEFPACSFSAALNDRLYLSGDPINPDIIYFTDAGNPERIDKLANSLKLPEGSGDAITGMVSAFGAIFIFKPNAIWRIDDIGGNRHQLTRLTAIGAVATKSIQVITDPTTGRAMIFFWSEQGPYVFDGSKINYIGTAIEESTFSGSSAAQYNWLDPASVVVGHNAVAREIICFYTPKRTVGATTTTMDRNGEAIVYNYRSRSWHHFTGMAGKYALSLSFTESAVVAAVDSASAQPISYFLFIGSPNGKIFSWGTKDTDAVPDGFTPVTDAEILTVPSAGVYTITGLTIAATEDLLDTWIAFRSEQAGASLGDVVIAPVIATDVTANTVTVKTDWFIGGSFTPAVKDKVWFCQPAAEIEFPWDELGQSFYDKQIVKLITWHDGTFKVKGMHNYDSSVVVIPWTDITDSNSQRKQTTVIKGKCEAFKLFLQSFDLNSSIDAVAYEIAPTGKGNTQQ